MKVSHSSPKNETEHFEVNEGTVTLESLRMDIRRTLGVSTNPVVSTSPSSGMRRLVTVLESLSEDELHGILCLARMTVAIDSAAGDKRREGLMNLAGEDTLWLLHTITSSSLDSAFLVAQEGVQLPEGMRFRQALRVADMVRSHDAEASAAQVAAHLLVAHSVQVNNSERYREDWLEITHVHSDKAKTIADLLKRKPFITDKEVIAHHGIEPVLFDGVL